MANQRWNKLWRRFEPAAPSIESCDAATISFTSLGWKPTAVPKYRACLGLKEGYAPKGLLHSPNEATELLCDKNVHWQISPIPLVSFRSVNDVLEHWEESTILVEGTSVVTADTRPYSLVPDLAAACHQDRFFLEDYQYDKNIALKWRGSDRH